MLWLSKMQINMKKVQDLLPSHLNPFRLRSFACFGAGKINEGHRGVARKRISEGLDWGLGTAPGTKTDNFLRKRVSEERRRATRSSCPLPDDFVVAPRRPRRRRTNTL